MRVDWKETFNPHDSFGASNTAMVYAWESGYRYLYWDGYIIDVVTEARIGTADEENEVYINGVKHTNTGGEK